LTLGPFPHSRRTFASAALLALWLMALPAPVPAGSIPYEIVPGPREITPEEKSLSAGSSPEAEHGVVLAEETDRDDRTGVESYVTYRLRAKIFSNEGRSLGDLEIPFSEGSQLLKWWAWTLLPEGTIREFRRDELREQMLASSAGEKVSSLKGALSAVTPGCIIEYGYRLRQPGIYPRLRVELQRSSPIRRFRYHWSPWGGKAASFRISRGEGLLVEVTRDSRSLFVTGKDLPAVMEEPYMPPLKEVRAAATLYYRAASDDPKDFWTLEAKREVRRAATFAREKPLKAALAEANLPAGENLSARLKAVYQWLGTHVKRTSLLSAEEEEEAKDDDDPALFAQDVLESHRATGRQMDSLFVGFARLLGAEAYLVLATDRTDHFFDPALLTIHQFDWSLAAIRLPDDPPDRFTFVVAGSGLPYGEIPWWLAGSYGFLADPKGGKVVILNPSNPVKNFSESKTSISFNLDDGTARVRWSRSDSGQAGLSERLMLRGETPENRRKRLEELCGAWGSFEILRAEAPGLEELASGLRLECEGIMTNTNFTPKWDRYSFRLDGVWEESVPELTATTRIHPLVFSFPRIDQNVIEVDAPPGYTTSQPPAVAPIESPYGHYALFITESPSGYHVERVFSFTSVAVPAAEYEPLRRFLTQVRQADRTAVEFRRIE